MTKYELEVLNEKGEVCYGWGKFNQHNFTIVLKEVSE